MAWNGSDRNAKRTAVSIPDKRRKSCRPRMLFLALLVCVPAVGVVVFFSRSAGEDSTPVESETASVRQRAVSAKEIRRSRPLVHPPAGASKTDGKVEVEDDEVARSVAPTNRYSPEVLAQLERFRREPLRSGAAQLLAMVSPLKKGDLLPPAPIAPRPEEGEDDPLDAAGERLLKEQGKVEEWDTEYSIEVKEEFEQLREEWRTAHDRGMSFRAFLESKQAKMEGDHEHLTMAKQLDRETYEDQNVSDDDYLTAHKKINNLLEIQGFDKLKTPNEEAEEDAAEEEAEALAAGQK